MVYIRADGSFSEKRTKWRFSIVTDVLSGIWGVFTLFFSSFTERPTIRTNNRVRTRSGLGAGSSSGNGGDGKKDRKKSNIHGLKHLGDARAPAGGG